MGVPLIYTRSVDEDRRFIRFFTPDGETEVFYNPITQMRTGENLEEIHDGNFPMEMTGSAGTTPILYEKVATITCA